jgi:hypothetical protein
MALIVGWSRRSCAYEALSKGFNEILADWKDIEEWNDEADKWENELDEKLERLAEQKQSYDEAMHILSNINILERSKTAAIASQLPPTLLAAGVTEKTRQSQEQVKTAKEKGEKIRKIVPGSHDRSIHLERATEGDAERKG